MSEHVNILLKDVVQLCVQNLNRKTEDLQQDKLFLEEHRLEAIQNVCDKMKLSAIKSINEAFRNIYISFATAENKSKAAVMDTINSEVMTLSNFKSSVMPKIKNIVENEAKKELTSLNASISKFVEKCVNEQLTKMSKVFSSHYSQFPSLKPQEDIPEVNLVRFRHPNLNFGVALSRIEALECTENKVTKEGVIIGALTGLAVGGPFGALAGAIFGGGAAMFAGDKSEEMRASSKSLMTDEISSFYSRLHFDVKNEIQYIRQRFEDLIDNFIKQHIIKYGNAVQKLIKEHQEKIQMMNEQIKSLRTAVSTLQDINDEVEIELTMLKNK